jgi:hypothetical protein
MQALASSESSGRVEELSELFARTAALERPELESQRSTATSAEQFWQTYLGQFDKIASTFTRCSSSGRLAALEWTAEGTLAGGGPIHYAGVSLLEYADDGKIDRFATYYDTAAFASKSPSK